MEELNKHYKLYHGVIINDRKVIGFYDKQTGRIIHASRQILNDDDVAMEVYDRFWPYYEDDFYAKYLFR